MTPLRRLATLLCILLAAGSAVMTGLDHRDFESTLRWRPATATVADGSGVRFTWTVDGQTYEGRPRSFDEVSHFRSVNEFWGLILRPLTSFLEKPTVPQAVPLEAGSRVEILYDPGDPSRCLAGLPSASGVTKTLALMTLGFAVVAGCLLGLKLPQRP